MPFPPRVCGDGWKDDTLYKAEEVEEIEEKELSFAVRGTEQKGAEKKRGGVSAFRGIAKRGAAWPD